MESDGKPTRSSDVKSNRKSNDFSATSTKSTLKSHTLSAWATKPHDKAVGSSGLRQITKSAALSTIAVKPNEESGATAATSSKRTGKAGVSSTSGNEVMSFRDVSLGPHEAELRFCLIHFWEARSAWTKTLIGEEMLLIDEEGHVIQGFIPAGPIESYLLQLVAGSVYQLSNFFRSKNKDYYRVADHIATVLFSWNSRLSVLGNIPVQFPDDRFRFRTHEEFQANCDKRGDLYDFIGHMKMVNCQSMTDHPKFDEVVIAETR